MKNIKADIANNTYKRIYLLCGDETYLIRKCRDALKSGIIGDGDSDVNYTYFDGNKGYDYGELAEIAVTLPFFADYRLIIVENSGLFKGDGGLAELLGEIPDTTVIVLCEGNVDKRTKLYKTIKEKGYICECATPSAQQLCDIVARELGGAGKKISSQDCSYFVNNIGGMAGSGAADKQADIMFNLMSELEKLICYTLERDVVTRADIDAVCSAQIENKLFDIVDMLMQKDLQAALKIYFDLIALREQPIGILRMMLRQYNRLLTIRDEMDRGGSDYDIASAVRLPDWVVRKYRAQLKGRTKESLISAVNACTDTEEQIKSGNISEECGMEILLANLNLL